MFSHVMIGSNDIERSKKFYDALFAAIGGKPGIVDPKGRIMYLHNGGVFMVSKPIDGKDAHHANGGTIGFAVNDQAEANAWHDAGVANGGTAIEDPPGALGIIEMCVQLPRRIEPLLHALLGDLVELHPRQIQLGPLELLRDVPRDGLSLAIRVGGKQHALCLLRRRLELGEHLRLALDDLVGLLEAVLDVDPHLLGQILDVALAGEDLVPRPKVLLDRLGLGR